MESVYIRPGSHNKYETRIRHAFRQHALTTTHILFVISRMCSHTDARLAHVEHTSACEHLRLLTNKNGM